MSEQEQPIEPHVEKFMEECGVLIDRLQAVLVGQQSAKAMVALATILLTQLLNENNYPMPPLMYTLRDLLNEAVVRLVASTPKATVQ